MSRDTKSFRCELRDVRAAKLCCGGARAWFRNHDIDWRAFIEQGVPANVLADTGDPLALRVVAAAEQRSFPSG